MKKFIGIAIFGFSILTLVVMMYTPGSLFLS
jgi:hypothetical protein